MEISADGWSIEPELGAVTELSQWATTVEQPNFYDLGALCLQSDPEAWFEERDGRLIETVKRICLRCPALEACYEYAVASKVTDGIWAGLEAADIAAGRFPVVEVVEELAAPHSDVSSVSWAKREQRWVVSTRVAGKRKHVGYFNHQADAERAAHQSREEN